MFFLILFCYFQSLILIMDLLRIYLLLTTVYICFFPFLLSILLLVIVCSFILLCFVIFAIFFVLLIRVVWEKFFLWQNNFFCFVLFVLHTNYTLIINFVVCFTFYQQVVVKPEHQYSGPTYCTSLHLFAKD